MAGNIGAIDWSLRCGLPLFELCNPASQCPWMHAIQRRQFVDGGITRRQLLLRRLDLKIADFGRSADAFAAFAGRLQRTVFDAQMDMFDKHPMQ